MDMPKSGYTTISLPVALVNALKAEVEINNYYTSVSELAKEGLREHLEHVRTKRLAREEKG